METEKGRYEISCDIWGMRIEEGMALNSIVGLLKRAFENINNARKNKSSLQPKILLFYTRGY